MLTRENIAALAARELEDGASVYLDPEWAALIRAAAPTVKLIEPAEGDVDIAVINVESITVAGSFDKAPARNAEHVIAIVPLHQGADGTFHVLKPSEQPLPGQAHCVITNLAVFDVRPEGLVMREVAQGVSALDVQLMSDSPLLASDELKVIHV